MKHTDFIITPGKRVRLRDYDSAFTGKFGSEETAADEMSEDCAKLARIQDVLMANETYALLVIFQAMDGSGKDGTIKHVMSALDPQGATARNFKHPSDEELRHDYLWRFHKELPERGQIGVFNRSYYEEVLATRVHPKQIGEQRIPALRKSAKNIWKQRFEQINNFEQYLVENGTVVLKFFLHLSKEKQRERLLERTELPEKQWKFSMEDLDDRKLWKEYMRAYEEMLNHTSTNHAPWHIIPADHRWFTSLAVAEIVLKKLESLKLQYPKPDSDKMREFAEARKQLE